MKKKLSRIAALLLALLLPLAASAEETDIPGLFAEAFRRALHACLVEMAEENAPPRVIDHIHSPDLEPDFAFSGDDDLLDIWFPIIRDQDAAIFRYQGQVWMLDCGDERAKVETVPLLRYLGIERIDRMINTHPHHDHLNGLYSIHEAAPVEELMICFPEDSTKHMTAAMEFCKGNGIRVTSFGDESVLNMGDGFVSFLCWQKTAEEESINDRSAQFKLTYGSCSMLFMADMEFHGQRQLYDALGAAPLAADILRYPHHGKRAMLEDVFAAIHPSLVIITNSSRGIELKESTRFLDYKHVPVAYTHRADWVIHLVTDGNRWLCEEFQFDPAPWLDPGVTPEPVSE